MRILLVDDCVVTQQLVRACLGRALPEAEVTAHAGARIDKPGPDFDWSRYDALLLDYELADGQTGIEWLREFGSRIGFPHTILMAGTEDPYVVAAAMKHGADGYLSKTDITPERLARAVREALAHPRPERAQGGGTLDLAERFALEQSAVRPGAGSGYRFGRLLGRGAGSSVYLAERVEDGASMALKILDRSSVSEEETLRRFLLEGEMIASIYSPYVVNIHEQGTTNSYAYMAMEFFGRGDLKQRLEHEVCEDDAIVYAYNIARGLEAIHAAGIVHRDLKPGNVMFRTDGSMAIADFGIAKQARLDLELTRHGAILGTPHYMSPEQARGNASGPRGDLYALGVMLYELLAGAKPFVGDNMSAVLYKHMHEPVPPLPCHLSRFTPVLERLMAKTPEDRFADAAEVCDVLLDLPGA